MAMEIITGSTGLPHVTSIDDAVRNGNVGYASGKCVFTYYENLRADDITANQIRIFSGYGMNQGRYFKIAKDTYEDVTIRNGTSGYKRVDLIVAKYQMDSQTGFESISLHVIEGRNGSTYEDPAWVTGDINGGDDEDDFPLYRIKLNGMALDGEPERMFNLVPDGGRIGLIERALNTGLMTDLASETRRTLNANGTGVDIGVKNILPIGHGGTGQNSAQGGLAALAGGATANTTTPADADTILTKSGTTWYQKAFSKVWDYIKGKLMGNTNYVTVANGGTGLGTVGANKVLVGTGDTSIGTKTLVTTIEDSSHDQIPTAKAVTDAMGAAGYGDMLSADYTTTVSGTKVISQGKGGTGSKDGSINGVKLGTNGNTKGYYDVNGNFKSFRQPTGTATAAQVLDGVYFANASSDSIRGTMPNRGAVSASLNTGATSYTIPAGYHNGSGKVSLTIEDKSVTATTSAQTVSPSSGKVIRNVTVNPQQHTGTYGTYLVPAGSGSTVPDKYVDQMSKTYLVDMGGAVHNNRYFRFELSSDFQGVVALWGEQIVAPNAINYVGDSVSTSYYSSNTSPVATSALTYTCTKRGPVVIIGSSPSQLIDNMTITVRGSGRVLDNQYTIANTKVRTVYNCLNGTTLTLNADSKRTNVRIIQLYNSAVPT